MEFEFMATHDPLTGVLNRRALFAQSQKAFARSQRGGAGSPGTVGWAAWRLP